MLRKVILPSYFFASSLRCGITALHGPHQVAQNSTTYVLAGSNFSTGVPLSHFATFNSGAGSPHLSVASAARVAGDTIAMSAIATARIRSFEDMGQSF